MDINKGGTYIVIIGLVFSVLISIPYLVGALSCGLNNLVSSPSFPAKPSMASAKQKFVIVLPPKLTLLMCSSRAALMIYFRIMLNSVGKEDIPSRLQQRCEIILLWYLGKY